MIPSSLLKKAPVKPIVKKKKPAKKVLKKTVPAKGKGLPPFLENDSR